MIIEIPGGSHGREQATAARSLITGISGFAGSHLAGRLVAAGDEVFGLARGPEGAEGLARLEGRLRLFPADITDTDAVAAVLTATRPDHIYHLAGFASPRLSFGDPVECHRVNVLGTAALFDAIRRSGIRPRVLCVSSGEVYGRAAGPGPIPEETPPRPLSPYGASKVAVEMIAIAAFEATGVPAFAVRSFNHVGPRQAPVFAAPAFAKQVAEAEAGLVAPELRVGNLTPTRDFADVRDVVCAYHLLMDRCAPGEIYNVATGRGITIRALLERLVAEARVPVRIVEDPALYRPAEIECLIGDPTRLERATGFRLNRPIEETVQTVLSSWRERIAARTIA